MNAFRCGSLWLVRFEFCFPGNTICFHRLSSVTYHVEGREDEMFVILEEIV